MRIGIVLPNIPVYSETFFRSKIKGLQQNNYEIVLFIGHRSKQTTEIDCLTVVAPKFSSVPFLRVWQSAIILLKLLFIAPVQAYSLWKLEAKDGSNIFQRLRSLIINSHILPHHLDWLHFGFATMGIKREYVGKAIGAKVATSFRGFDISIYPLKHPTCYDKLWDNLDKVHTISNDLLKVAYNWNLRKEIPAVKIAPAINVESFHYSLDLITPLKEPFRLLTVGRMHWKKGGELILDALSTLKKSGYSFTYTWIGDGPERDRLLFAAQQNGLINSVSFVGRVQHEKIPRIMQEHDIYIQYSIQEGFCNSVLEAQAAGMLVVVSDAEGLKENVIHEETGWVVPKLKPRLLAKQLASISRLSIEQQRSFRTAAQGRVMQNFKIEQQIRAFISFYEKTAL